MRPARLGEGAAAIDAQVFDMANIEISIAESIDARRTGAVTLSSLRVLRCLCVSASLRLTCALRLLCDLDFARNDKSSAE